MTLSQAPFCLYTLRAISGRAEGTFGRLRYSLGGDRPSQTARLTLSRVSLLLRLEFRYIKGGIPRAAPRRLASSLPCLPPILYVMYQNPMSGYSKAPWGLSVQSRVTCIFTGISISPGPSLRQCPNRYTFRAGRNLPDKEFRYLRTVIVTAAVHRGFDSELSLLLLTFRHWAGVSPYTSSFDFAETCVFAKQLPGPIHCGSVSGAPLIPKLRGQFAEFLNYPSPVGLRILFLSTCVGLRYGHLKYSHSFSRLRPSILPYSNFGPLRPGKPTPGIYPFKVSLCLNLSVVTEYQPFVHRLRLSASP